MEIKDKIPETLKECCEILDSILPFEMIREIKESESYDYMIKFHFDVGMYIRNNWLESEKLLENLENAGGLMVMRDSISGDILDYYWFYLHGYINGSMDNLEQLRKSVDIKNKNSQKKSRK